MSAGTPPVQLPGTNLGNRLQKLSWLAVAGSDHSFADAVIPAGVSGWVHRLELVPGATAPDTVTPVIKTPAGNALTACPAVSGGAGLATLGGALIGLPDGGAIGLSGNGTAGAIVTIHLTIRRD